MAVSMPRLGSAGPGPGGAPLWQGGADRQSALALLGALCIFLSAAEYLIPKPLPFMRIGLANMPLLLALGMFGARDFFLLALLKVAGQGLIGGAFLSFVFLFSVAGTFASAAVMLALGRLRGKRLSLVGISCAGAMASNGAQLLIARHPALFGEAARYLAPPFLAAGLIAGIALGIVCERFCRVSRWHALRSGSPAPSPEAFAAALAAAGADAVKAGEAGAGAGAASGAGRAAAGEAARLARARRWDGMFGAGRLFAAGLAMALVFLSERSLPGHFAQFLFFCLLARLSGKSNNWPASAALAGGIVFFSLLVPHGRVLFALGPLPVTQGSLLAGLEKALTISGLMMLSRACVRDALRLPGALGSLLARSLRLLGMMRGKKALIKRGSAFAGIDRMMLEMEAACAAEAEQPADQDAARNNARRRSALRENARRIFAPGGGAKGALLLAAMALLAAALGQAGRLLP